MSSRKTFFALSMLAGLAASSAAVAQGWHGGHGGMRAIMSSLQLTSAQKQQIHTIMSDARTTNEPQMQQLASLRKQTESMMFSTGSVTAAQLAPLLAQEESIRQQLDTSRMETQLAVRAVLTSDQLAKAASTQAQLASLHDQEHALVAPTGTTAQ